MIPGDDNPSFFPVESLFRNSDNPQDILIHGLLNGGNVMRRVVSFTGMGGHHLQPQAPADHGRGLHADEDAEEIEDQDEAPLGGKKRRLSPEQVEVLEKSFEENNKLDLERKLKLAKLLNLQPRQVSIWFQNRRARCKTKQLEKDFDEMKKQMELLRADNEVLRAQNNHFQSELIILKSRVQTGMGTLNLNHYENDQASWSAGNDNGIGVNLFPTGLHQQAHFVNPNLPNQNGGLMANVMFTRVEEQPSLWPWPEHQTFP